MQEFKVEFILISRISPVAIAVYAGGPFGDEMGTVSAEKSRYPHIADGHLGYLGRCILYHFSCRRKPVFCKPLNVLYKLLLLLWAEFTLEEIFGASGACQALVPSGQRRSFNIVFGSNFCILKILSWFSQVDFFNGG